MPELLRVVTLSPGGRPIPAFDLASGENYMMGRGTFAIERGDRETQMVRQPGRFGGERAVADRSSNARAVGTWYVEGATADAALANVRALASELESPLPGRYVEWRPEGASWSVLLERRGAADWQPTYRRAWFRSRKLLGFELSFPVAPVALGLPMDVADDFAEDSLSDYTLDAGTGTLEVSGGKLRPLSTTAKRIVHTARGYDLGDAQATLKVRPGTFLVDSENGPILKRLDGENYLTALLRKDDFTPAVNLVTNPSVEVDTAGLAAYSTATIARVTSQALRGAASLEVNPVDGAAYGGPKVTGAAPLTGGDLYSALCAVRVPNAGDYHLNLHYGGGAGPPNSHSSSDVAALVANQWTWLWVEGLTAGEGAVPTFLLYKDGGTWGAGEVFHMDAMMLVEGVTIGEYVDGAQPRCVWDGTAHASTSRQSEKINRIPNPSFETGVGDWVGAGAGSILQSEGFAVAGAYGASVESSTGDDDGARSALLPITGGNTYTLAIRALVPSGQLFRFRVERLDAAGANIAYGTSPDFIGAEPVEEPRVRVDLDGEGALIDAFEIEREQDLGPPAGEEGGTEATYSAMEIVRRNYVDNGHFDVDVDGWEETYSSIARDTFPYRDEEAVI